MSFLSGDNVSEGGFDPVNVLAVGLGSRSSGDVAKRNPLSFSPSRLEIGDMGDMGDMGESGSVILGAGGFRKVSMIHCFSE